MHFTFQLAHYVDMCYSTCAVEILTVCHRSRSTATGVQACSAAVDTTAVSGDSEMANDTAGKVCSVRNACLLTGR